METNHPTIPVVLDEGAFLPERAYDTDAGADIRTPVALTVPARGSAVVHTGVHVQTPPPDWMKCCPTCGARITEVAMP